MRLYFLVCSVAGVLLCLFLAGIVVFKLAHPISNARIILPLLVMLAVFVWAAAEMVQEYRKEKSP